jgi:hypothetical protein
MLMLTLTLHAHAFHILPVYTDPACGTLCMQEARTIEELQMQHLERARSRVYFAYMKRQADAQAAAKAAAHDELVLEVEQSLQGDADVRVVATRMQQQLGNMFQLRAEHIIMQHWSERFAKCGQVASERFASL